MNGRQSGEVSAERILKATISALVVATLILVLVIWPFRFGIGMVQEEPASTESDAVPPAPAADAGESTTAEDELAALIAGNIRDAEPGFQVSYPEPFKSEQVQIALDSGEEVEFKAHMAPGDTIVYSWRSPQPLYVDLHGEPYTYPDEPAERYEEIDGMASGSGRVTARFAGMHGWFWLNTSEVPVVIELSVSGYYEKLEEVHRSSP